MKANYRLKSFSPLLIVALFLTSCASGSKSYKLGRQAELSRNFEEALQDYKAALDREPGNIEYRLKYEQVRYAAAYQHFQEGMRALEKNDVDKARSEFTRTLDLDPSHALAEQELARVNAILASRSNKIGRAHV